MAAEDDGNEPGGANAADEQKLAPWDRVLLRVDCFQRRHRPTAFLFGVVKKFGDDRAGQLAALIAYYGFFSLFPLLLVFVTVLGFVLSGNEGLQQQLLDSALSQFPVVGDDFSDVDPLEGSGVALAIGIGAAVWAGLGALQAAQTAMNEIWDVPIKERPNFVFKRVRAVLMLVLLGGAVLASTLLSGLGTYVDLGAATRIAVLGASLLLNTGLFLVAYRVLTDRDLSWGQLLPGALVAGTAWVVLQTAGSIYVTRTVEGAGDTYGAFAVVIGLLSWMHLQAQVAILAGEINVVRDRRLWPRSLTGRDLTDADRRALGDYALVEQRVEDQRIVVAVEDDVVAPRRERPRRDRAVPTGRR